LQKREREKNRPVKVGARIVHIAEVATLKKLMKKNRHFPYIKKQVIIYKMACFFYVNKLINKLFMI